MPRLQRMDGLRGLLAVYVMLGHALPFTTLPGWATAPFSHGEAAVDLFFALSGLVISQSLTHHPGIRAFIAARARRLLPVYFLVLAASILLLLAGDPLPFMPWTTPLAREFWAAGLPPHPLAQILTHLTLTHGLIPQGVLPYAYITLLGPAWSLSTEFQFYLLLPALGRGHERRAMLVLLALALLWTLAPPGGAWAMNRAFLPSAAGYFALGLATARRLKGAPPAEFAAVLALACLCAGGPDKALIPLAWALIVLAQRAPWGALLESRPLLWLGALSYPLYLVNEPVQRALALVIAAACRRAFHHPLAAPGAGNTRPLRRGAACRRGDAFRPVPPAGRAPRPLAILTNSSDLDTQQDHPSPHWSRHVHRDRSHPQSRHPEIPAGPGDPRRPYR